MLLIDSDAHAEALGDFGKIAAGVGCRQQSEFAGGSIADSSHLAGEFLVWESINRNVHHLADLDLTDICFLDVSINPNPLRIMH